MNDKFNELSKDCIGNPYAIVCRPNGDIFSIYPNREEMASNIAAFSEDMGDYEVHTEEYTKSIKLMWWLLDC